MFKLNWISNICCNGRNKEKSCTKQSALSLNESEYGSTSDGISFDKNYNMKQEDFEVIVI